MLGPLPTVALVPGAGSPHCHPPRPRPASLLKNEDKNARLGVVVRQVR